jgi:hypothetical protein
MKSSALGAHSSRWHVSRTQSGVGSAVPRRGPNGDDMRITAAVLRVRNGPFVLEEVDLDEPRPDKATMQMNIHS